VAGEMNKKEEREWKELVEKGYLTPDELRSLNKIPETVNISLVVGEVGREDMYFPTGSSYFSNEANLVPSRPIITYQGMEISRIDNKIECEYCHRPNQLHRETCKGCGAVLPIR
jgi:hypothetical protein